MDKWHLLSKFSDNNLSKKTCAMQSTFSVTFVNSWNMTHIGTPSSTVGMFDIEDMSFVRPKWILNLAFKAGSSKHGKALLASVGWNWVTAMYLFRDNDKYVNFWSQALKNIGSRMWLHFSNCTFVSTYIGKSQKVQCKYM